MNRTKLVPLFFLFFAFLQTSCEKGTNILGESCSEKTDCDSGYCLMETVQGSVTGWQDGYCTAICAEDSDCLTGSTCHSVFGESYCLASCTRDSECRQGYVCNEYWETCLPDCHNEGWDCGDTLTCADNGQCTGGSEETADNIGQPCVDTTDCTSQFCIKSSDPQGNPGPWTEGYCSLVCANGVQCPEGSQCYQLDASMCLVNCEKTSDCRDGYVCDTDWFVCLPDCRETWNCKINQTCDADGVCKDNDAEDGDVDVILPDGDDIPTDGDDIPTDGDDTPPDGDNMPPDGDGPPDPVACVSDADCLLPEACPPNATKGCVCKPIGPNGEEGMGCVPSCETNTDCPEDPQNQMICTPENFCAPGQPQQ